MTIKSNLPIFSFGQVGDAAQDAERAIRAFQARTRLEPWTKEEEEEAIAAFMAWGRRAGLETGVTRRIDRAGAMLYDFEIVTGRGKITATGATPTAWNDWIKLLGLDDV